MKSLKLFSLLLFVAVFCMTSCKKENIDTVEKTEVVKEKVENNILTKLEATASDGIELGCVTINYPFQLVTINSTVLDINDEAEFEAAIIEEVDYVVDFVYPINLVKEDGTTAVANDVQELGELFASCIPDHGWNEGFPAFLLSSECISIVYPIDLTDENDNTVTVNSEQEFVDAMAANNILFFVFPFNVENDSLGVLTVTDPETLFEYLSLCEYVDGGGVCDSIEYGNSIACYEMQFPISFELADGSIAVANDLNELNSLWFNGDVVNFSYPLTLVEIGTGEITVVNSDTEFEAALAACWDGGGNGGGGGGGGGTPNDFIIQVLLGGPDTGCFTINYPLTGVDIDGNPITMNNEQEFMDAVFTSGGFIIDLPLTLTTPDGTEHTINTAEEIIVILENC